jgi:hypothetical protein
MKKSKKKVKKEVKVKKVESVVQGGKESWVAGLDPRGPNFTK